MPFCSTCGQAVGERDLYCARCGAQQPVPAPIPPPAPSKKQPAGVWCYVPFFGWIASLYVLAAEEYRRDRITRFHAFQGLYLFVAWLIVDRVIGEMFSRRGFDPEDLGKLAIFVAWIFMMVQTSKGQLVRLPLVGDLADKSVAEQQQ